MCMNTDTCSYSRIPDRYDFMIDRAHVSARSKQFSVSEEKRHRVKKRANDVHSSKSEPSCRVVVHRESRINYYKCLRLTIGRR